MTGSTRKSRPYDRNSYVLRSPVKDDSHTQFRTTIEATPPSRHGQWSGGSRDDDTDGAALSLRGWPRMESTITVHSWRRDSVEGKLASDNTKRVGDSFLDI